MNVTEREEVVLRKFEDWEQSIYQYQATDFEMTFDKWVESSLDALPENVKDRFFSQLDTWLFYLHSLIQSTQAQEDVRQNLLTKARIFNHEVESIADLKKLSMEELTYLAEQQVAKHRLYSFAQGGMTGIGGILLTGSDLPSMTVLNLRAVQLIALTYGYEINHPFEMMTSLKVFHLATLPKRMQYEALQQLKEELDQSSLPFFYEGSEELTDGTWLEHSLKQVLKLTFIQLFRRKLVRGIPLISMTIGAASNYQMTRKVTEVAHRFYQYRYIMEKGLSEK